MNGSLRTAAEAVVAPQVHDGIGKALRHVYLPGPTELPRTLQDLLDRLN